MTEEAQAIVRWVRDAADMARQKEPQGRGPLVGAIFDALAEQIECGIHIELGYYTPPEEKP